MSVLFLTMLLILGMIGSIVGLRRLLKNTNIKQYKASIDLMFGSILLVLIVSLAMTLEIYEFTI